MRLTLVALFVIAQCSAALAQDRLVMGWTDLKPLFNQTPDGNPGGFGVEVMTLIAERAGFELDIRRFETGEDMIAAQVAGEIDLTPGLANSAHLARENVFSDPISRADLRAFVRAETDTRLDPTAMSGQRIGISGLAERLIDPDVLADNTVTTVPVGHPGIVALLTRQIDVLISGDAINHLAAYEMRVDHRLVAVGPPLGGFERVIVLRKDHADRLPAINAAIAALQADGTLKALRERYQTEMPPPPPETLIVGVYPFPPYNIVREDGSFSGFSVESLRNIAEAAGVNLRFQEISRAEWEQGPGPGRYDIIPQIGVNAERLQRMDVTKPVDRSSLEVFVRAGEEAGISDLTSLQDRRIGVEAVNAARKVAEEHGGLDLTVYDGHASLLDALIRGEVDAILYPRHAVWAEAQRVGKEDAIVEIEPPFHVIDRAIALRFGLGSIRERMNAVIPGYLASPVNEALREAYFGDRVFWTPQRAEAWAIGGGVVVVLIIAGFSAIIWYRNGVARRDRRRYAYDIIDKLPIGIVVVSPKGDIEFANDHGLIRKGDPIISPGRSHREAVTDLVNLGLFDLGGRTPEELIDQISARDSQDATEQEYLLTSGKIVVRRAQKLANGSMLLVRQDITEDRRQSREIETLNAQLQDQIALARASNEELRSFAYATSHDLKAPTNTSRMLIDLLADELEGNLDEDQRELLDDLRATNARMGQLIADVLDYTDTIGTDVRREEVDLTEVLQATVRDLRADIEAAQANVNCEALPKLAAHPSQMRQLMQNLVANAIKFRDTTRSPVIEIAPEPAPEGSIAFSVTDNGIGIPTEHQPKIFRLFERLKASSDVEGSGLGLSVCQRIVNNHRGRIEVQSTVGAGTRFTVTLGEAWHDPQPHVG